MITKTIFTGTAIGEILGVDYSTVSQGRKRLREKLKTDKHYSQIIKRVESDLSINKDLTSFTFFLKKL